MQTLHKSPAQRHIPPGVSRLRHLLFPSNPVSPPGKKKTANQNKSCKLSFSNQTWDKRLLILWDQSINLHNKRCRNYDFCYSSPKIVIRDLVCVTAEQPVVVGSGDWASVAVGWKHWRGWIRIKAFPPQFFLSLGPEGRTDLQICKEPRPQLSGRPGLFQVYHGSLFLVFQLLSLFPPPPLSLSISFFAEGNP